MHDSDGYLARFAALHPRLIDLSLGRMERLLDALGHPERRLPPVIHVAGTNGKGSTIAFLRAMLEASGARVHTYTSPHLVRFHERIRLAAPGGGKLVTEEALVEAFERIEKVNAGEPITFFEITTVVAFDLFARHPADYVLLEVGLGGRLDTTNVVEHPAASVITPISMDHREFLGDTVEKIAFEKAGILKRGTPAIFAEMDQAAFLDLPLPRLAGRHQILNAATAIATLLRVAPERVNQKAIETGLLSVEWPGRFQRLTGKLMKLAPEGAELWLDGGHNADGARVLAEALSALEERSPRPLVLMAGTMARKNAEEILQPFVGLAQEFLAVPVPSEGARLPEELASVARKLGMPAAQAGSVEESLRYLSARTWPQPPRIVITGSLYLAGDVLQADGSLPK